VEAQRLLRLAVEARIEAWDHPFVDERDEAAGEVGLMLQEVIRDELPDAIPACTSLDGVRELSARTYGEKRLHLVGAFYLLGGNEHSMLPVDAELNVSSGAPSRVSVGGEASVFAMPTSERQFARRMENVEWSHHLTLHLA
jgi:hypothetical protein